MKNSDRLTRRRFIRTGLLASTLAPTIGPATLWSASAVKQTDGGLKLGITTYTLRKFTLDQAIAMTQEADLKYISLKDMHLPMKSTREERVETHKKVEAAGLTLTGGGVIALKNQSDQIREAFEYCRDAGMPTMICSPEPEGLDTVEVFAKRFKIRIAIHNHGPGDKHFPSPLDIFHAVKDRDPLMGLCMDVGHTVRNGEDPVSAIEKCSGRLYDFHMKDVSSATAGGSPVEVGKGVIDIPNVLKALIRVNYSYNVALEYEAHADDPMPGVKGSVAYMRSVLVAMK